jgi:hypothetical protein
MIRKATEKDIEDITAIGLEFGIKSRFVHTMQVDEFKIRGAIQAALVDVNSVLLVSEINGKVEGAIFGMVLQPFFSEEKVLQELALYSRKQTGFLHLLDAFEDAAKDLGVNKIVIGSKPAFCNLRKIYERRGYTLLEEQYLKVKE